MDAKKRIISALSYLWILFWLPLVVIPNSSFGRFHANQALLNLLLGAVCWLLGGLLRALGIRWIFSVIMGVFTVWGIVTALMGEEKPFPVIGKIHIIG